MSVDLLRALVPHFGCVIEPTSEGLRLTGASRTFMNAAAGGHARVPRGLLYRAVASTDSTNLRLKPI